MAKADPQVAQHGGICEVALPAAAHGMHGAIFKVNALACHHGKHTEYVERVCCKQMWLVKGIYRITIL